MTNLKTLCLRLGSFEVSEYVNFMCLDHHNKRGDISMMIEEVKLDQAPKVIREGVVDTSQDQDNGGLVNNSGL